MYDNRFGRFTAVDPLLASGKSANPQTFNRFAYTGNSPLIRKDPDGKDWIVEIQQSKRKVTERIGGRSVTREITETNRTPVYVERGEAVNAERLDGIWHVSNGTQFGFQALHPTLNQSSQVFKTKAEAQAVYNEWVRGTEENPIIKTVVFEPTVWGEARHWKDGIPGHVANSINNETFSWEGDGYEANRGRSFDDYLNRNFDYRSGTVFELDFGSPARNRAAAEEIRAGPQREMLQGSGYNVIRNNCGETTCRIVDRLKLPHNGSMAPWQHYNYINENLRQYIRSQQRFVYTPPRPSIVPIPQPLPTP